MKIAVSTFIFILGSTLNGCGRPSSSADAKDGNYKPTVIPEDFTTVIDNPYFSLPVGKIINFKAVSEEGVELTRIEMLNEYENIMGVQTIVYHDLVYIDGELVEETRDYLAQNKTDGSVWYFGEKVDNYENGKLVDHEGSWTAGTDGALPGIWIKGSHQVGDLYRQEYLEGEAEDMREVEAVGIEVKIGEKTYKDCVRMYDWTPLDEESKEHKTYCPAAQGLVLTEHLVKKERTELLHVLHIDRSEAYQPSILASDFSTDLTGNPLFKLPVGKVIKFKGKTEDGIETIEIEIMNETKIVTIKDADGKNSQIETRVYRDRVYLDGEMIEDTKDYLAQHRDGSIWYFGEDVDNYEDGKLADHDGSWIAGQDGALPGIWIKANPKVGDSYKQEYFAGEAEDISDVIAVDIDVSVGGKTYSKCVKFLDWTPLEPESLEYKTYCPEVGALVLEEHLLYESKIELTKINQK